MSCAVEATATLFSTSTITTSSLSTSLSTTVETLPGSTSTTTLTGCAVSLSASASVCPSPVSSVSIVTGSPITTTVISTIVSTIPITETQTTPIATQFTTICPSVTPSPPSITPSPSPSLSTPPPSLVVSSSLATLANGQLTVINVTVTSTPPASTIFATPSPSPIPNLNQGSGGSSASANLAPIIGGSLGGFFGLIAVVVAFLCYRRSRQWDDIFEKNIGHGIGDDDIMQEMEPAPYHYGLVGHTASPPPSPPASPRGGMLQQPAYISRYSRVSSSGNSMYSRDSMVPLTHSGTSEQADSSHVRGGSLRVDIPLLNRPLHQSNTSLPSPPPRTDRRHSTGASTLPSPGTRRVPSSLFVTNSSPDEPGPSRRPLSAGGGTTSAKPRRERRPSSQQDILVHTDGGRVSDPSTPIRAPDDPPAYTKN